MAAEPFGKDDVLGAGDRPRSHLVHRLGNWCEFAIELHLGSRAEDLLDTGTAGVATVLADVAVDFLDTLMMVDLHGNQMVVLLDIQSADHLGQGTLFGSPQLANVPPKLRLSRSAAAPHAHRGDDDATF